MLFQKQVDRLTWLLLKRSRTGYPRTGGRRDGESLRRVRAPRLEYMEARQMMAADPIQIGAVYVEEDLGSDLHGDLFYVTFQGGAPGTELRRLVLDGDMNGDGFNLGDVFFDTIEGGLGADHAYPFKIEQLQTSNPSATVTATVQDGSTRLVLDFTNFVAGDRLVFSIDVDEVQFFDPNETDLAVKNDNFDPITSGVEFQNTQLHAEFTAPHYEDAGGESRFRNRYDDLLDPTGLPLPRDNEGGKRDRSAGATLEVLQTPKPVSLSGFVYVDANEDLVRQANEQTLSGVEIELFRLQGGSFVSTGHKTTTDNQGRYSFGTELALQPGTYQIRESQPTGYYSVGASIGRLNGSPIGEPVAGNPDILTQIALPLGDLHATDLNFAENLPSSISGRVRLLTDGFDCFDEEAELQPMEGVLIELRDASGNLVASTRTDSNGGYSFQNLRAGTYSVTEYTPTGVLEGDAQVGSHGGQVVGPNEITQIIIGGGVSAREYVFCEVAPSQLNGHAFLDINNNGRREAGETPLADVSITLWDEAGNRVAETRTDAQGVYQFTGLRPGNYRLTEVTPSGYRPGQAAVGTVAGQVVGQADASGDVIDAILLPAGSNGVDYDFGEILPGSITGRVFSDLDGDCVFDIGETGIAGVTIELLDIQGNVLDSVQTDSSGRYRFTDLLPAVYAVREVQPSGYFHGGQRAGTGGGDDSQTDLISSIQLGPGQDFREYNFCEVEPAGIAGIVFSDLDEDCVRDANERPIANVEVQLIDANGTLVATTRTDSQGNYRFNNLRPGRYSVREIQPSGYFHGGQKAGTGGGDDSLADVISSIDLRPGNDLVDYNFCEVEPATLGGIVFADLDFDAVQDANESPISNVRVELLDAQGRLLGSTQTDAQGRYEFENLRPGIYSVREVQPTGYFQGGQIAPVTGGTASTEDLIAAIPLRPGQVVGDADFYEVPPAEISGYVFQDGDTIVNSDGQVPEDLRSVRDGQRTADDAPIAGVWVELRTLTGAPVESSRALPGFYEGPSIRVQTDASGYFVFPGIRAGSYHIYQRQPEGFEDGIDTAGTTTGYPVNRGESETVPNSVMALIQLSTPGADPGTDAILAVAVNPAQASRENNFSEIIVQASPPTPPLPPPSPTPSRPDVPLPPPRGPAPFLTQDFPIWAPLPLIVGAGHDAPPTWHLSVINGGYPRGHRGGETVDEGTLAKLTERLDLYVWSVTGMQNSSWRIVSLNPNREVPAEVSVFDVPGAKPLAGDFNGDGFDELALFIDGEWFIDFNGNGRWDEEDIWIRLGTHGDQPVVGDWDGDGKDDVGIFGRKWDGDERALAHEPGLPDPENQGRTKPKNLPPTEDEAPDESRVIIRTQNGRPRADVIDHVFQFGGGKSLAVSGDFNGDGIATIGTFRNGRWILDVDGDGKLNPKKDRQLEFGQMGDLPIVGNFDLDPQDEIGIVRGNQVIVDSNHNGRIDATDQVFLLETGDGSVIVGDFDGDGIDEPALHQSASQRNPLSARRLDDGPTR